MDDLSDPQVRLAAAALAAAVAPTPVGVAVAAGAAMGSPRVRSAVRRGVVHGMAGAMRLGDTVAAAAREKQADESRSAGSDPEATGD